MGADEEKPQAKRARICDSPLQQQAPVANGHVAAQGFVPSCTTGATTTPSTTTSTTIQHPLKAAEMVPNPSAVAATGNPSARPGTTASGGTASASRPPVAAPAAKKAGNFIADAREAVHFRAVSAPCADALAAEIAAGGAPVSVDFLHQHFGDSEQIRGYSALKITFWIHLRTYHIWVHVVYSAKRPGADKLGDIFDGAFPSGYCRSQDEFVQEVSRTLATLPDLTNLGDCVGKVPVKATAYGIRAPSPAATASSGPNDKKEEDAGQMKAQTEAAALAGPGSGAVEEVLEVSVQRFQLTAAPTEVKALHARLEPLLLFTIDGANFIDDEDPQWELLLPVARMQDGGCVVLGLTTLFNFFAYPASCRLRVSQVLVLSPWQGLGLGKAMLRLSYDLAKARGCADLTVEDPTPNLQRVREKLEVEMLRGLPWVAKQADQCLAAAARGETSWPAWTPEPEPERPASDVAVPHLQAPENQPKGPAAQHPELDPSAAAGSASPAPSAGCSSHPLLGAHGFFAALGAVPPKGHGAPETIQREATAAAEARWRQKLEAAEAAAATTALTDPVASADAAVPSAAAAGDGDAVPGLAAGVTGGSGSGSEVSDVFVPSAAFVVAVSRELKMHRGQVRVVWEALLWCHEGTRSQAAVRAALERLVARRLESQHFSSVGRAAAAKRIVETPRSTSAATTGSGARTGAGGGDDNDVTDFFMYRPMGRRPAAAAGTAEGAGASRAGSEASAAVDTEAVATGRLNLTQVTADDKARRMAELTSERLQQLQSLEAVLSRAGSRTG